MQTTFAQTPATPPGSNSEQSAIVTDPLDSLTIFIGTKRDGIFRTTDGGATWHQVMETREINGLIFYNAMLFACTTEGVFRSADRGDSWVKTLNITGQSFFLQNGTLHLRTLSNGVFVSTGDGDTWQRVPEKKSFWQKNRSWLIPTAAATIIITALIIERATPDELAEFPGLPPNTN